MKSSKDFFPLCFRMKRPEAMKYQEVYSKLHIVSKNYELKKHRILELKTLKTLWKRIGSFQDIISNNNSIRICSWVLLIEKMMFRIVRKQNLSLFQVYPWININTYQQITCERCFPASTFLIFINNVFNLSNILRCTSPAEQYKSNRKSLCQRSTLKISQQISLTATGWLCHKGTVIPVVSGFL